MSFEGQLRSVAVGIASQPLCGSVKMAAAAAVRFWAGVEWERGPPRGAAVGEERSCRLQAGVGRALRRAVRKEGEADWGVGGGCCTRVLQYGRCGLGVRRRISDDSASDVH